MPVQAARVHPQFQMTAKLGAFLERASKVLLVAAILSGIDPGPIAMLLPALRTADRNPTRMAYQFALEHPGEAYFPKSLTGTLYSFGLPGEDAVSRMGRGNE